MYVTGFAKLTKLSQELKSNLQLNIVASYTQSLPRHTNHIGIDGQVCFHVGLLPTLSIHKGALQAL